MYTRIIEPAIKQSLFRGKVVILYGPRQVGKTTLAKKIISQYQKSLYLSCDSPDVADALTHKTAKQMRSFFGDENTLVVLDEAQTVANIGTSLKLLVEAFPDLQIIATGSSSFDLANELNEPLTGRYIDFFLYPLSLGEIGTQYNGWELRNSFENMLISGTYPEVWSSGTQDKEQILDRITESYLFKDILRLEDIKSPFKLRKLLQAVALQVGNELSTTELGQLIELDKKTVERYLDVLQKAFIIFELRPLSRNLRKELSKLRKVYFYDLGIRNSLIHNLNATSLRTDIGGLWENFCILERMKKCNYERKSQNTYFWRTYDQQEIDYVEEFGGSLHGYEFKWGNKLGKVPKIFMETYPQSSYETINPDNLLDWILTK